MILEKSALFLQMPPCPRHILCRPQRQVLVIRHHKHNIRLGLLRSLICAPTPITPTAGQQLQNSLRKSKREPSVRQNGRSHAGDSNALQELHRDSLVGCNVVLVEAELPFTLPE